LVRYVEGVPGLKIAFDAVRASEEGEPLDIRAKRLDFGPSDSVPEHTQLGRLEARPERGSLKLSVPVVRIFLVQKWCLIWREEQDVLSTMELEEERWAWVGMEACDIARRAHPKGFIAGSARDRERREVGEVVE
jgi:hypothetical protein